MGKENPKTISINSPISSVHLKALLEAIEYQGSTYDCGPYATASVINGLLGKKINPAVLSQEMSKPVWQGLLYLIRRIPNWATFPWGMVDVFRKFGLQSSWKIFSSPDEIKWLLNAGGIVLPILGRWKPLEAHIMALVAWDPVRGWGFANTQYDHHNISWMEHTLFMHDWKTFLKPIVVVHLGGGRANK